jgi:hypothetical protein
MFLLVLFDGWGLVLLFFFVLVTGFVQQLLLAAGFGPNSFVATLASETFNSLIHNNPSLFQVSDFVSSLVPVLQQQRCVPDYTRTSAYRVRSSDDDTLLLVSLVEILETELRSLTYDASFAYDGVGLKAFRHEDCQKIHDKLSDLLVVVRGSLDLSFAKIHFPKYNLPPTIATLPMFLLRPLLRPIQQFFVSKADTTTSLVFSSRYVHSNFYPFGKRSLYLWFLAHTHTSSNDDKTNWFLSSESELPQFRGAASMFNWKVNMEYVYHQVDVWNLIMEYLGKNSEELFLLFSDATLAQTLYFQFRGARLPHSSTSLVLGPMNSQQRNVERAALRSVPPRQFLSLLESGSIQLFEKEQSVSASDYLDSFSMLLKAFLFSLSILDPQQQQQHSPVSYLRSFFKLFSPNLWNIDTPFSSSTLLEEATTPLTFSQNTTISITSNLQEDFKAALVDTCTSSTFVTKTPYDHLFASQHNCRGPGCDEIRWFFAFLLPSFLQSALNVKFCHTLPSTRRCNAFVSPCVCLRTDLPVNLYNELKASSQQFLSLEKKWIDTPVKSNFWLTDCLFTCDCWRQKLYVYFSDPHRLLGFHREMNEQAFARWKKENPNLATQMLQR